MNVNWSGYYFTVYDPKTTKWNEVGGIYIFAMAGLGGWSALYIGQADSFSNRIPNHERWSEALRLGATHIHALVIPLAANRDIAERHLIQAYLPRLNSHLK